MRTTPRLGVVRSAIVAIVPFLAFVLGSAGPAAARGEDPLILLADGEDNCTGGPGSTHRGDKSGDEAAAAFRPMFEKKSNVPMPGAAAAGGGAP